jgi:hypothetical protein
MALGARYSPLTKRACATRVKKGTKMIDPNQTKIIQQPFRNDFFESLNKEVQQTIRENKVYAKLCQDQQFSSKTEITPDNLESIPYLTTTDFKLSANTYRKLLRTENIHIWTVSSGTSEDPSVVGRTEEDIELMYELWRRRFKEFFFYDTVSTAFNFAPESKLMKILAKRESHIKNSQMFLACINDAYGQEKSNCHYLVKLRIPKTIVRAISTFSKTAVVELDKNFLVKELLKRKPEDFAVLCGNALLMNNLMLNFLIPKKISFDFGNHGAVCSGGGGWEGVKAQIKMEPVNKEEWVERNYEVYGIKAENIRDIYGFNESSTGFGGHWSNRHKNFIMHCPPSSRILVRNQETYEPVKVGDNGLIEVVSPYAVKGYVGVAILGDDIVSLLGDNRSTCPECGYKGAHFMILGRSRAAPGRSCASLLKWV